MIRFLRLFNYVRKLELDLQQERDAQSDLSRQLHAERELRKAADQRAENYHDQLVETYQSSIDWFAEATQRRKMFGETTETPSTGNREPLRSKLTARAAARKIESDVLRELHEEMTKEELPVLSDLRQPQEGPEYAAI